MPWSVPVAGTTTSQVAGRGAPAATEKQVPDVSRTGRQLDAVRSPTTFSRTGRPGIAGITSSDRAAYPSIAAWSNAGSGPGATTSSASVLPYAWVRSRSSAGNGRTPRSTQVR